MRAVYSMAPPQPNSTATLRVSQSLDSLPRVKPVRRRDHDRHEAFFPYNFFPEKEGAVIGALGGGACGGDLWKLSHSDVDPANRSSRARIFVAANYHGRIVTIGQLVLFSTETGDAWLLDPADRLAARLARDGDSEPIHIEETDTTFAIGWKGRYRIKGPPSSIRITTAAG